MTMFKILTSFIVFGFAAGSVLPYADDPISEFFTKCSANDNSKVRCLNGNSGDDSCFTDSSCTLAAAVETTANGYEFSMLTVGNQYVTVGFSSDTDMGNDPCITCKIVGSDVIPELSLNSHRGNEPLEQQDGLTVVDSLMQEDKLYCKFTLNNTLAYASAAGSGEDFYLLIAAGPLDSNNKIQRHSIRSSTDSLWNFAVPVPEGDKVTAFYDLCDGNGQCIGAWSHSEREDKACFEARNCTFAGAIVTLDDGYEFSMLTTNGTLGYVAIGFSLDQGMGDDSVISCVKSLDGTNVTAELSYNEGYKNKKLENTEGLTLVESVIADDLLYCRFQLNETLTFAQFGTGNDTDVSEFYFINVAGVLSEDGNVGHHYGHAYSEELWKINSAVSVISSMTLMICTFILVRL